MARLRDELFGAPAPKYTWIVPKFPAKADYLRVRLLGPADIAFRFSPNRSGARDVLALKARRFGELVKRGVKPWEAAHQLHTTVRKLMEKPQTQAIVTEIVEGYTLDPKVRALLLRATQNKMLLTAVEKDDTKTALDVMRLMADDSELGIKGTTAAPTIGISPELKELLDRTVPKELPAPVDVEFKDVENDAHN